MKAALFGAAVATVLATSVCANAQEAGVFEKWLSQEAPECVPVSAFKSVSTVTDLTQEQFQFVRALYVALPPVSRTLPPGDHAVMASSGKTVMLALVADGQACAPVANHFYFREPRSGFLSWVCRILFFFRFGLLIIKVPLPRYSALYSVSSAKTNSPVRDRQI